MILQKQAVEFEDGVGTAAAHLRLEQSTLQRIAHILVHEYFAAIGRIERARAEQPGLRGRAAHA